MTTVTDINNAIAEMREVHASTLVPLSQAHVVEALCDWARQWESPSFPFRHEAEALNEPFPFEGHVRPSLEALIRSINPAELDALLETERVRGLRGADVIGHVIAANTPLLAWTSVLRALLMRSASLVKLPRGPAGEWGHLFLRSLHHAAPTLASSVTLLEWPGGTVSLDAALCSGVDLVMANGGDTTIAALRALTPARTPFVGYGHAISFALVADGADWDQTASALARDVLVYDGGGCLSVKTVFVQGTVANAARFAATLSGAMEQFIVRYGAPKRSMQDWQAFGDTKSLGAMRTGAQCLVGVNNSHAVLVWPEKAFRIAAGAGIVCVQPWRAGTGLPVMLGPVRGHLQGCAIAGKVTGSICRQLELAGVSRQGAAGTIQEPPLSWRQDGRDVLRSLLPNCDGVSDKETIA